MKVDYAGALFGRLTVIRHDGKQGHNNRLLCSHRFGRRICKLDAARMNYLKQPNFQSEKFRRAVASQECAACGSMAGSQAAHENMNKGMGLKVSDARCAALCVNCHRELDQGTRMNREERRQFWKDAYITTIVRMLERGLLVTK